MKKKFWYYFGRMIDLPVDYWGFLIVFTFIILAGITGLLVEFQDKLNFVWQLVLFSFALVGATFAAPDSFLKRNKRIFPLFTCSFISSGCLILGSVGLMALSSSGKSMVYQRIGEIVFFIGIAFLSLGLAAMFLESIKRVFKD